MTNKQKREHKIGNQLRKQEILKNLRNGQQGIRGFFNILGGFQDGKYTPRPQT